MDEELYITRWIQNRLGANTELAALIGEKIYVHKAPQDVARPWLVIDPQGVTDVRLMDTTRLWVRGKWTIKVVGRVVDDDPPFVTMVTIMNLVDGELQGAEDDSDPDIEILSSHRTGTIDYQDDSNYEHVGETFEIQGKAVV
jgi:hypothetical protein